MKLDRRFLDFSLFANETVNGYDGLPLPNSSYTGHIYFAIPDSSGGGFFECNGSSWEEMPAVAGQEVIISSTGDIYKYDGTDWDLIGEFKSYIVVNDVLEDKVGESPSNETHKNGDKYLKTTDNKIYTYNGSNWTAGSSSEAGNYLSMYDFKIYTRENSNYTSVDLADNVIILNKSDLSVYAYNSSLGLSKVSSSGRTVVERHTVTSENLSNDYFSLSNHIKQGTASQILVFVNGVLQEYDVDYNTYDDSYNEGTQITWGNKSLENTLKVGDKFTVQYLV